MHSAKVMFLFAIILLLSAIIGYLWEVIVPQDSFLECMGRKGLGQGGASKMQRILQNFGSKKHVFDHVILCENV